MKHILVPTDFSESANNASKFALDIAKSLQLPVRFLHSVSTPVDWTKLSLEDEKKYPETKERINSAKNELKKWEQKASKNNVEAEYSIIYNTGMDDLVNYVHPKYHKLVVMGTHGTKGIEKILGSNTQKLIRQSQVPVLAIKSYFDFNRLKKILIATDLQEKSLKAFEKIYNILTKLKSQIEIVYINTPYNFKETDEIDNMANEFLGKIGIKDLKVRCLNANNEARGLGMALNKLKPDLFTSITHHRTGFDTIFSPSITEEIINNYNLPVLSINREI